MNDQNDTSHDARDREFAQSLRGLLRDSEEELDFNATTRLAAARARALDRIGRRGWWTRWTITVPGAAMAAALMWALLLPREFAPAPAASRPQAAIQVEVMESFADEADLLVDFEFYQWLDEAGDSV